MSVRSRLARRRVPLGFVFGALCLWLATPTTSTVAAGALVALVGQGIRLWAAGHLEKGREVTTSGPYGRTRHPLYAGSSIMGIGFAIASASVVVAALVVLYLGPTLWAAVRTEEDWLSRTFGPDYAAYRAGRSANRADRQFSWARVARNREYRAVLGLVAVLAILAWKAGWGNG